jgi:spore coat protein A, manganese oxidase
MTLIESDGGLLPKAVTIMDGDGIQEDGERLVIAPGDRADVVIDFSNMAGKSVTLLNEGPAYEPFKGFNPDGTLAGDEVTAAQPDDSVGQVMRFNVVAGPLQNTASVDDGTTLNSSYKSLKQEVRRSHASSASLKAKTSTAASCRCSDWPNREQT